MVAIETIATVEEDGKLTIQTPSTIAAGQHRVVVVIDEVSTRALGPGAFPEMANFRAQLGVAPKATNSVVEMREQERDLT
ncbi:MAG: hypothetical protein SF066_12430 [Thermoanaerobaculia bacterium]|nr:hypothetical protein [Thermoanaerobaculia bacterium]